MLGRQFISESFTSHLYSEIIGVPIVLHMSLNFLHKVSLLLFGFITTRTRGRDVRDVMSTRRVRDVVLYFLELLPHLFCVDHIDQMIQYYPVIRKTIKWSKKLFWWKVELAQHNAHVVYNEKASKVGGKKLSALDFQLAIIRQLVHHPNRDEMTDEDDADEEDDDDDDDDDDGMEADEDDEEDDTDDGMEDGFSSDTNLREDAAWQRIAESQREQDEDEDVDDETPVGEYVGPAPKRDPPSRLVGGHKNYVMFSLPPTAKKICPQRACRVCTRNGLRRDTRYYCKQCQIPLCKGNCWARYHSVLWYYPKPSC